MLDLSMPARAVEGVDLAGDQEFPRRFYVLPPPVRVAVRDGRPDVLLLRLVKDGRVVGGHFRLSVALAHPLERLEAARRKLAAELRRDDIELAPLPVLDASAELLFAGRETTAEGGLSALVRRGFGLTPAAFAAPHRASFSVDLTPQGVTLFETALRSGGAPVGVNYRLRAEGLWPAQRVIARVDYARVYDHFSRHLREGFLLGSTEIRKIVEDLVESRAIVIEAVQGGTGGGEATAASEIEPALAFVQRDLVERFCDPVMPLAREPGKASLGTAGEIFSVGSDYALKKLKQIELATALVDLQRRVVALRTLGAAAHLADLTGGAPADALIADAGVDHPFFQRLVLRARAAEPLASLHIREALLHFAYGTARETIRLTPESPEGSAEAWLDAAPDRTWSLTPEVTFLDTAPFDGGGRAALERLTGQDREVSLDFRQALALVKLELRAPTAEGVLASQVTVEHRRGEEQVAIRETVVAPGAAETVWFRGVRPADTLEASVEHLLGDGRVVRVPPWRVDTAVVPIPPAFPGFLTVQLIADGDWTDVERVAVALQKTADSQAITVTLDKPGKVAAVNLDMPDPADRTFRYRMTRLLSSGTEEDPWVETDVPVVEVGRTASNMLVVELVPLGPELPQAGIRLIEVELLYLDIENQVRDAKVIVIGSRNERPKWQVRIADPRRKTYEYRVKIYPSLGGEDQGPWKKSAERILPIPIVKRT